MARKGLRYLDALAWEDEDDAALLASLWRQAGARPHQRAEGDDRPGEGDRRIPRPRTLGVWAGGVGLTEGATRGQDDKVDV